MNNNDYPVSEIAGLLYCPTTDMPFGKTIRIGNNDVTIFERVIEQGYLAGVQAFKDQVATQGDVEILDDQELTGVINERCPHELSPRNQTIWRAYFVVGYTCAHLGQVPLE
jgi:hypothetical protein